MNDVTAKFLDKASRSIRSAERSAKEHDHEAAANRAYYAMFYVAEALLNERGLQFRRHGGVQSAFGQHFVKTGEFDRKFHRWLLEAFEERITADYEVEATFTSEDIEELIAQAQEFLDAARRYLGGVPS